MSLVVDHSNLRVEATDHRYHDQNEVQSCVYFVLRGGHEGPFALSGSMHLTLLALAPNGN